MRLINVIVVVLTLLIYCYSHAFDNRTTHPKLTDAAVKKSNIETYLINNLSFIAGLNTTFLLANSENNILFWLTKGADIEDVPTCRASNHFHNPLLTWGQSQMSDDPSWLFMSTVCSSFTPRYSNIVWATGQTAPNAAIQARNNQIMGWDNARQYFYNSLVATDATIRDSGFATTFQSMGQVMHLLQDMAVPAHVRNDFRSHLKFTGISSFNVTQWYNNPFEYYVRNNPTLITSVTPSSISLSGALLTDFWDTDQRTGAPFEGLAESVNKSYFSDSTIPQNDPTTEHQFPAPLITTSNYICTDKLPGSKKLTKYVSRTPCPTSGGEVDHFAAVSLVNNKSDSGSATSIKKVWLDDNVHNTYATETNGTLAKAIGYSSSLLDYFFRGTIELSLPAKGIYSIAAPNSTGYTEIRVKARNSTATNEEMSDGKLQLVVKYKMALSDPFQSVPYNYGPEQYIVIAEKSNTRTLSRTAATELVFDLTSTPLPFWAVDVYLQVVYHGQLGNESNSVAVGSRDISEPTPIDVVNNMDLVCINNTTLTAGSAAAITAADLNHDGKADYDVFPHGLTNVYLAFNGAVASASNHQATFANIPPGGYGRIYVLGDYSVSSPALLVSTAVTVQKLDILDAWTFSFGTGVDGIDAVDNQTSYPLIYVIRGSNSWWYTYYQN